MPYSPLPYAEIKDKHLREVLHHADMYLSDVYRMLDRLPRRGGGAGNFSMTLVLLCIVDGLAAEVWPRRRERKNDQEKRFKKLIRFKLAWGLVGAGKWLDKGTAADQLYTEFRNPLVHELAKDKRAGSRPRGYVEPTIGVWGDLPGAMRNVARIDALPKWDDAWPILSAGKDDRGQPRLKLNVAGLYWAVKRLALDMAIQAK